MIGAVVDVQDAGGGIPHPTRQVRVMGKDPSLDQGKEKDREGGADPAMGRSVERTHERRIVPRSGPDKFGRV